MGYRTLTFNVFLNATRYNDYDCHAEFDPEDGKVLCEMGMQDDDDPTVCPREGVIRIRQLSELHRYEVLLLCESCFADVMEVGDCAQSYGVIVKHAR